MLVVVGSSNAVNLTDGLDGLAIGLMVIAAGAMTVFAYVSGHTRTSPNTSTSRALPGAAELTIFCGSMTGAIASASSGTTRIPPKSSWATSARSRSAAPWASWPS